MQNIKKYIVAVLFVLHPLCMCAQDAMLFLNDAVPIYHNPANTGNEMFTRGAINYRNHYPSTGSAYITYTASFDTFLDNINSGLGAMFMRDEQGSRAYVRHNATLAYSYKIKTGDNSSVRAGLTANISNWRKDPNGLLFPDQIGGDGEQLPSTEVYDKESKTNIDFAFGSTYNYNRLAIGASISHLGGSDNTSFGPNPMRFYAHAQYTIPFYGKKSYVPLTNFQTILKQSSVTPMAYYWHQGNTKLFGIGADLQLSNASIGLFSRQDIKFESMTASFKLGFTAASMGINYIIDLSYLSKNYRGLSASSHEIAIILKFGSKVED